MLAGPALIIPLRTGRVTAHRTSDGSEMWSKEITAEQPLTSDEQKVYVTDGDALHAFDAATGELVWRAVTGGKVTAPPLAHGGWVFVAAGGELLAIRADDGTVMWRKQLGTIEFRPSLDGELLVVSVVDGNIIALAVQTGQELWRSPLESRPTEPFAIGDRVYVGAQNKKVFSLYAKSGRIEWHWRVGAVPQGRAFVDDRHVYFTAMNNVLYAFSRRHGAEQWHQGLPYRPAGGPVVLGSVVLVPGYIDSPLPAFDAATGQPAGKIPFPATLIVLPVFTHLADGNPVVIGITGGLDNKIVVTMLEAIEVPPINVQPLTVLPGEAIPLANLTVPVLR